MIQRVVLIRLKPEFRAEVATVVSTTLETLGPMDDVLEIECGSAADVRTKGEWDVVITLRLQDLDSVERYRAHETHRAYVDVFLKPMMHGIRVYNFEIP